MIETTPVIDFHNHVGRWGTLSATDFQDMYVKVMDRAGVDVASVNCIFYSDARYGNDIVADYVSRRPDRFVGVAFVTPHYPEETVSELERAFGELNMRSLKVYPTYYQKPIDDPLYMPIFEWCDEREIVVMSHSSFTAPDDTLTHPAKFIPLAKRFSRIRWVLAHSGNLPAGQYEAIKAAQECPNIYLETATSMADHGTVERLVAGAGEDRVLFGSDMPLMDMRNQLGRVATADISDDAKRKVLGLNAAKLLNLDV